jgi:SPP1 family predicted phage head-tail adaptor
MGKAALAMKAGSLQKLVKFERRANSLNAYRESKDKWTPITTAWASIQPLSGRESFFALQAQSDVNVRIVCRYSSALAAVKAQDRIVYRDKTYDIRHEPINKNMQNRELEFMCTVHAE